VRRAAGADPRRTRPSLTHGDLWIGNILADDSGQPALIDPAVSYTWPEIDLAMLWVQASAARCGPALRRLRGNSPAPFTGWQDQAQLLRIWGPVQRHRARPEHMGTLRTSYGKLIAPFPSQHLNPVARSDADQANEPPADIVGNTGIVRICNTYLSLVTVKTAGPPTQTELWHGTRSRAASSSGSGFGRTAA